MQTGRPARRYKSRQDKTSPAARHVRLSLYRLVLEAIIHHAKKLKDQGELSYSTLFGFPVEAQRR